MVKAAERSREQKVWEPVVMVSLLVEPVGGAVVEAGAVQNLARFQSDADTGSGLRV